MWAQVVTHHQHLTSHVDSFEQVSEALGWSTQLSDHLQADPIIQMVVHSACHTQSNAITAWNGRLLFILSLYPCNKFMGGSWGLVSEWYLMALWDLALHDFYLKNSEFHLFRPCGWRSKVGSVGHETRKLTWMTLLLGIS